MKNAQTLQIGTAVSYEDIANPRRAGKVAQVVAGKFQTDYIVKWDNGTTSQTSCRGAGWVVAA